MIYQQASVHLLGDCLSVLTQDNIITVPCRNTNGRKREKRLSSTKCMQSFMSNCVSTPRRISPNFSKLLNIHSCVISILVHSRELNGAERQRGVDLFQGRHFKRSHNISDGCFPFRWALLKLLLMWMLANCYGLMAT